MCELWLHINLINHSQVSGKLTEQSRSARQTDDETLSLLMTENSNMAKDKWKSDSTNNQSNGQMKIDNLPEHRLSVLSLGYVPTAHPTS